MIEFNKLEQFLQERFRYKNGELAYYRVMGNKTLDVKVFIKDNKGEIIDELDYYICLDYYESWIIKKRDDNINKILDPNDFK
jgi:hypothetical protein